MAIEIELDESDFVQKRRRNKERPLLLGEKEKDTPTNEDVKPSDVSRLLPTALAMKIERSIPDNFVVQQIQFDVKVSGSPFGVGLDGSVKFTIGPKTD